MLTNPAYAGAYVYGRRAATRAAAPGRPGSGRGRRQRRLAGAAQGPLAGLHQLGGPTRGTSAQLAPTGASSGRRRAAARRCWRGCLVCGRCGQRMATCYRNNGRGLRYGCTRERRSNHGGAACQSLSGRTLDAWSPTSIVEALRPRRSRSACSWPRTSSWSGRGTASPMALAPGAGTLRGRAGASGSTTRVEPENRLVARTPGAALGGGAGRQGRARGRARAVHGP